MSGVGSLSHIYEPDSSHTKLSAIRMPCATLSKIILRLEGNRCQVEQLSAWIGALVDGPATVYKVHSTEFSFLGIMR
jgi:hypothetical protein